MNNETTSDSSLILTFLISLTLSRWQDQCSVFLAIFHTHTLVGYSSYKMLSHNHDFQNEDIHHWVLYILALGIVNRDPIEVTRNELLSGKFHIFPFYSSLHSVMWIV